MKQTIFSVIDYINRQCIDDSCWGLQTIYEECQDNNTAEIFGTQAKDQLQTGTYRYLYLSKEQLNRGLSICPQPANIYLLDVKLGFSSTHWLAIWKLL